MRFVSDSHISSQGYGLSAGTCATSAEVCLFIGLLCVMIDNDYDDHGFLMLNAVVVMVSISSLAAFLLQCLMLIRIILRRRLLLLVLLLLNILTTSVARAGTDFSCWVWISDRQRCSSFGPGVNNKSRLAQCSLMGLAFRVRCCSLMLIIGTVLAGSC